MIIVIVVTLCRQQCSNWNSGHEIPQKNLESKEESAFAVRSLAVAEKQGIPVDSPCQRVADCPGEVSAGFLFRNAASEEGEPMRALRIRIKVQRTANCRKVSRAMFTENALCKVECSIADNEDVRVCIEGCCRKVHCGCRKLVH